jgi:DNA-binding PadR family transcriptional regulator
MSEIMEVDDFLPLPHLPYHILLALAGEDAMHGWAVIKRIEEMTGGRTCPSTGSLYLAMGRLQERGMLEEAAAGPDERDQRRKFHRLTSLGRRVLAAESTRLAGLIEIARTAGAMQPTE